MKEKSVPTACLVYVLIECYLFVRASYDLTRLLLLDGGRSPWLIIVICIVDTY